MPSLLELACTVPNRPQPALTPDKAQTDNELRTIFRDSIFYIALFTAGLYGLLTVLHFISLPEPVRTTMVLLALCSSILCTLMAIGARKVWIKVSQAYAVGFILLAVVLANSIVHMWMTGAIEHSSNFALIFVAIGLFFLSRRNLIIGYLITFTAWAGIAFSVTATPYQLQHFAIMCFQAALIGVLAQEIRLRAYHRLIGLRAEADIREQELTKALAHARLYATVERENKAKTEFLANMSHELRTPLNAIMGFSETMSKELFGPLGNRRYVEYATDIHDAGTHLLSLVNDILDLSRIELEGMPLTTQKIDLEHVCSNCLSIVRGHAERGNVALSFESSRNLPDLYTDERRLKQVLINLLSNAVKFTPPGGQVILKIDAPENGSILLHVIDTGIGMNAEAVEKARTPFWQADAGLDRAFEGAGLGLALVNELLRLMGGDFILESEEGRGTIATISLPVANATSTFHTSAA